jgi:EH_Signature domain
MRAPVSRTDSLASVCGKQLEKLTLGRFALKEPHDLIKQTVAVRKRFGDGHSSLVSTERIVRAVEKLRSSGVNSLNKRDRYVLAYGMTQQTPALDGRAVTQVLQLYPPLFSLWSTAAARDDLRGAEWRGLFRSYLQVDPGPAASALASVVGQTFGGIVRRVDARRPWFQTIKRHLGLLGPQPCQAYVAELLEGRREQLDDLTTTMAPPPSSWFWDALATAIADQLPRITDDKFKARIQFILGLTDIAQLTLYRDNLLAGVLDRYAQCRDRNLHRELLDFALEHWKSPQLASNLRWKQVAEGTKQMACGWLAVEDLTDFYQLCQGDRQVDERRLKYWLRYKEQIVFSQIVLGSALFFSRESDIRDFRQRKKGRIAQLVGGGDNNAIVMQIGQWLFVESSEIGNACYPYRLEHVPFDRGALSYVRSDLKNKRAVKASGTRTLTHMSDWESKFAAVLDEMGIVADEVEQGNRARRSERGLLDNLRRAGATTEDLRKRGGCLWVYVTNPSTELQAQLLAAGFKLRPGRGYYHE